MKRTPVLLLLLFYVQIYAQSVDLDAHLTFFQQQSQTYQDWLQQTALDQVVQFHSLKVIDKQGVAFNLQFTSTNPDDFTESWNSAKKFFEENNLQNLEDALFFQVVRLLDLKADQAFLQISDEFNDKGQATGYFIKIYTDKNELKIDQNFPKGYLGTKEINLNIPSNTVKNEAFREHSLTQDMIFDGLEAFIKKEYNTQNCPYTKTFVGPSIREKHKLSITVSGLCREVLEKRKKLLFCEFLKRIRLECSSAKRETLTFTFLYNEKERLLTCYIEGQYSDDYFLFRGKNKSMDDQFKPFLVAYTEEFLDDFEAFIKN